MPRTPPRPTARNPATAAQAGEEPPLAGGPPKRFPVTPDGRYFVVRGRLWRLANPALPPERRAALTRALMAARRQVGAAQRAGDPAALAAARAAVDAAKRGLGERGPAWWTDGAPDLNRSKVRDTPYAGWFATLPAPGGAAAAPAPPDPAPRLSGPEPADGQAAVPEAEEVPPRRA